MELEYGEEVSTGERGLREEKPEETCMSMQEVSFTSCLFWVSTELSKDRRTIRASSGCLVTFCPLLFCLFMQKWKQTSTHTHTHTERKRIVNIKDKKKTRTQTQVNELIPAFTLYIFPS